MTDPVVADDLYYDPYEYGVDAEAQAIWKRMRDEAPVYRNDQHDFYALSRYDDVLTALLDTERYSSAHGTVLESMSPVAGRLPMMIYMDPPEHGWHRKVVSRAFTARTMSQLEGRVTRLCNQLLDELEDPGAFDFLDDYGAVIPPVVILALLGFPEGHEDEWRNGVDAMFHRPDVQAGQEDAATTGPTGPPSLDGFGGAALLEMLPDLLEHRRHEPSDDLLSVLVHTDLEEPGGRRRLDDREIAAFVLLLSIAGTETVARLLGWVAVLLDQHPDQRRLLAAEPGLVPNAIEECLRYEAPSPVNGRWLTRAVELHGVVIPEDARVLLLNGSANRDERHFPDPDRFDVTRPIDRHLSFGYGAHFCVGAALARLEGRIALREVLRRYPTWEVDHERAEMVHTSTVRGYARVPVTARRVG